MAGENESCVDSSESSCGYECNLCQQIFVDVMKATDHLKTQHGRNNGDSLQCIIRQTYNIFCASTFKSFKALRKHMREKRCRLFSNNLNQNENVKDSCERWNSSIDYFGDLNFGSNSENDGVKYSCEGWNNLIYDFGDLNVEGNSEQENVKYSLAAHIESLVDKLIISKLPHDIVNDILNYSKDLVHMTTTMNLEYIRNSTSSVADAESILNSTEKFVTSQLNKYNTRYKRKKHYANSPHYVEPTTISVNGEDTFQYDPILKTLEALFANNSFKDEYFAYNINHQCKEGVYERFCCGQNYKNSDFFQSNEIQIQIFFDDVQLTAPLKTKPHKVNAIYFIVRNFPPKFVSKLDNMFLVSLCDSVIVKKHGCNSILNPFVQDLKILETDGITIDKGNGEKIILKGTLMQVSFDNLGGNEIFGFVKCFTAHYYCRICFCSSKICNKKTTEVADRIRTKEHFNDQIAKLPQLQGTKFKSDVTFGVSNYSVLNDLNFFHTIENRSQDIMHDVYEGAMPFILNLFLKYLVKHEIITTKGIEDKISSFDYGILERKNVPSKFYFKKNLNQNASQMRCLMRHVPFIFIHLLQQTDDSKRRIVHKTWVVIEYMLKINQIISSQSIEESYLVSLEKFTHELLMNIKKIFGASLIPKLHFMTHYPNTIRKMGPLANLQMMRGDAKHQPFTQYAKRCKNYINISKTLSEKHQEVLAAKWGRNIFEYKDEFETSKKMRQIVTKEDTLIEEIENHSELFRDYFGQDINRVVVINFLLLNSFTFRKGLFVSFMDDMHQIDAVLKFDKSMILLCTKYTTVKFFKFSNCFEIQKSTQTSLININMLVCKRTFEAKLLNNRFQIIADNLDMVPIYEKYVL